MNRQKAVVFDFDGTLFNSISVIMAGVSNIFKESGLKPPPTEDYIRHFRYPFMDFYRSRGVVDSKEQILKWFIYATQDFHEASLFEDALDVCAKLGEEKVKLAIISGQKGEIIDSVLRKVRFGKFYFTEIIPEVGEKTPKIEDFKNRHKISSENVFYVGDLVVDILDSVSAGVVPVGITRGYDVRADLLGAGARHCIDHLPELLPIVLD